MATLTQQNAKLNQRLKKAPAWQSGAPGGGQANALGSIPSPHFPAGNLPRQNATPSAEGMKIAMRSIKDIQCKHRNNGENKEVSKLNNIL